MKKWLFGIIILLLFIPVVIYAQETKNFEFNLEFYQNDTVILNNFNLIEGRKTEYLPEGKYSFKLFDEQGSILLEKKFDVKFIIFTEPPRLLDHIPVILRIPYTSDASKIIFYHDSTIIYQKEIKDMICNRDKICNGFENYLSCPEDCPSGSRDNYCDKILDGICDPDCAKEVDIDCTCGNNICDLKENAENCPKDCKPKNEMITLLLISLIAIALLLIFYRRFCIKRKKRPKKSFK
jgi:hypothetical protein